MVPWPSGPLGLHAHNHTNDELSTIAMTSARFAGYREDLNSLRKCTILSLLLDADPFANGILSSRRRYHGGLLLE